MKNYFYKSTSNDGWRNLAQDEWFINNMGEDELMLYLYVNENAVIIGKNQNPWKECNLSAMEQDNVQLVRRISGGGAVYHDMGNLNFSFIANKKRYDLEKQMSMILSAVRMMGIDAEATGRNDITVDGKKFSGNAFATRGQNMMHHGTLLLNADLSKLPGYLTVDPKKIKSKGIDSVRARVVNLNELNPSIDMDMAVSALRKAFTEVYGDFAEFEPTEEFSSGSDKLYRVHSSWEWRMGNAPVFDYEVDERFPFGNIQLFMSVRNGCITEAKAYSDALDHDIAEKITGHLTGVRFTPHDIASAIRQNSRDSAVAQFADYMESAEL